MTVNKYEFAKKWSILLRHQAQQQHSTELASSSLIDLANNLDLLLEDNKALGEKCNDYDTLKERLAELEGAAKPSPAETKPVAAPVVKSRVQVVKEPSNAVA